MAVLANPGMPGVAPIISDVDRQLRIEVKNQSSMYEATIIDIREGVVTVKYDDGTFEEIFASPGRLRNIPVNACLNITPDYAKNQLVSGVSQVELKAVNAIRTCNFTTEDNATSTPLECWERRRYVAVASGHLLIVSDSAESSNGTMVVDLSTQGDCVRLPNAPDNKLAGDDWTFDKCTVKFAHIDLQATLKANKTENTDEIYTILGSMASVNDDLLKRTGALQINYNPLSKRIVALYQSPHSTVPDKMDLFKNAHTLMLSSIAARQTKVNAIETVLNDEKAQARHTAELKVGMDLAKFGILDRYEEIYYQGKRVKEVRKFEGVQAVYVMVYPQGNGQDDSLGYVILRVVAHSKQVLDEAIGYLEFTEQEIEIPERFGNRVVGNKGELIEDLIAKCGIIRVACRHELPLTPEGNRTFVLIGQKSKLPLAEELIRYQVNYLLQEENLEAKMVNLNVEVAKARGQFITPEDSKEEGAGAETDSGYKTTQGGPVGYTVPEGDPPEEAVKREEAKRASLKAAQEARIAAAEVQKEINAQQKQQQRELKEQQRQMKEQQKQSPRAGKSNPNRRNNRGPPRGNQAAAQTTDNEGTAGFTDTDTGLSDTGMDSRPPSYAQLARERRAAAPRAAKQPSPQAATTGGGETTSPQTTPRKERSMASQSGKQAPIRDANNNPLSAGDARQQKPLPQRQNRRNQQKV